MSIITTPASRRSSQHPKRSAPATRGSHVTFSDAITAVRRWLWLEWVFAIPRYKAVFEKLSRPFRSPAAPRTCSRCLRRAIGRKSN